MASVHINVFELFEHLSCIAAMTSSPIYLFIEMRMTNESNEFFLSNELVEIFSI